MRLKTIATSRLRRRPAGTSRLKQWEAERPLILAEMLVMMRHLHLGAGVANAAAAIALGGAFVSSADHTAVATLIVVPLTAFVAGLVLYALIIPVFGISLAMWATELDNRHGLRKSDPETTKRLRRLARALGAVLAVAIALSATCFLFGVLFGLGEVWMRAPPPAFLR